MKFKKIYIELSDICGLKCDFCPSKKGVRGVMSVQKFSLLLPQIKDKAKLFSFHILGDPLYLENLKTYVNLAKENAMKLEITTSGFYLNPKNRTLLLENENIRQINISLISFLGQRKVGLKEYFEPIFELCKQHFEQKCKSFINLRLWNLNPNFTAPKKNFEFYKILEQHFQTKIDIKQKQNRLQRHILLHQARLFKWVSLEDDFLQNTGVCYALKEQIGILSDGSLVPCCFDTKADIFLGNVFKQNFNELLNSKRLKVMKEAFTQNKRIEALCQRCEFFQKIKVKN